MDIPTLTIQQLKSVIEGLLFMAGDEGLSCQQLVELCECDEDQVQYAIALLQQQYTAGEHGLQVKEIAGAYRLGTLAAHAAYFQKLAYSPTQSSITQASLETLAIIAYRQPITRVEIEEIRGVKSDRSLQTLTSKGLIFELGRSEAIGRPILYGTTKMFLDHFGLNTVSDLPEPNVVLDENTLEEETKLLFDKLQTKKNN
jgi:segregation and condensation protein B